MVMTRKHFWECSWHDRRQQVDVTVRPHSFHLRLWLSRKRHDRGCHEHSKAGRSEVRKDSGQKKTVAVLRLQVWHSYPVAAVGSLHSHVQFLDRVEDGTVRYAAPALPTTVFHQALAMHASDDGGCNAAGAVHRQGRRRLFVHDETGQVVRLISGLRGWDHQHHAGAFSAPCEQARSNKVHHSARLDKHVSRERERKSSTTRRLGSSVVLCTGTT